MSTMKKRIPMFLLALAMMVAMALPTFAASYRPNAQFGYLLNINGSTGSAYQGRALNLMKTDTMGTDQNFIIGTRKGYTGYYMMVTANVNYAVNRSDMVAVQLFGLFLRPLLIRAWLTIANP